MLVRRIAERIRSAKWGLLALELLVVVVGILLAFQLDRAHQASQNRQLELRYLKRIHGDVARDTTEIAIVLRRIDRRLAQVRLLTDAIENPSVVVDQPDEFVWALEQAAWRSVPVITTNTFDELKSTGRMTLIRSERLRSGLADYYAYIAEQKRLGFGEDDQDRFRLETLGLLSGEHLSAIEDSEGFPIEISPDEAVGIAQAFASRERAHLWLGRLTKYQVLMRQLSLRFDGRARDLLAEIESEMARLR